MAVKEKLLQKDILYLKYKFSKSDFVYLHEYITCTSDLALAIDRLQADNCHYDIFSPDLVSLKSNLCELLQSSRITVCKPLLRATIKSVETWFANFFNFDQRGIGAAIASVSRPYFKGRWLGCFTEAIQNNIYDWFVKAVSEEITDESPMSSQNSNKKEYNYENHTSNIISKFETSVTQAAFEV